MTRPWRVRDRASFAALRRNGVRRRLQAIVAELPLAPGTYLLTPGRDACTLSHQDLRALVEAGLT